MPQTLVIPTRACGVNAAAAPTLGADVTAATPEADGPRRNHERRCRVLTRQQEDLSPGTQLSSRRACFVARA